jgi:hypothetical protein
VTTKSKHTPGPYTIKESGEKFQGFTGYLVVGPGIVNKGEDYDHSSAMLVARSMNTGFKAGVEFAGSDLLAAARRAAMALAANGAPNCEAAKECRAAIAKAEGGGE